MVSGVSEFFTNLSKVILEAFIGLAVLDFISFSYYLFAGSESLYEFIMSSNFSVFSVSITKLSKASNLLVVNFYAPLLLLAFGDGSSIVIKFSFVFVFEEVFSSESIISKAFNSVLIRFLSATP